MTSGVVMTKTPFPRKNSSSMEEDEEEEDFRDVFSPQPISKSKANSSRSNGTSSSASMKPESSDKDQPIEIKKVVSNAMPVVNKMSQQIYADHQSQAPAKGLKRYKILSLIGDGTYGLVYMATNVESREKVAIKAMKRKYHSWDEVMDLREVKSLKKLHHPNVVKLKEVIRENSRLYFVFEYVKGDLLGLMREKAEPFPEFWIRSVIQQVLQGLAYMHRLGFFHRDLKPENILATGPDMVKIADFGLAREIRSSPPYTDYVSTRWYRAPEVLLRSTNYNSPIDIWAVGCITSELYTKRPLFPGSSEIDQLYKVASVLGTPGRNDWSEGFGLANAMNFRFPTFQATHLSSVLGSRTSARAVSFLYAMLSWNPSWRSSAQEALRHSFFRSVANPNKQSDSNLLPFDSDKPDGSTDSTSDSMLSLSLRPRNHDSKEAIYNNNNNNQHRVPLPLTEIEPHYSRDLSRSTVKPEQTESQRPKSPVQAKEDNHLIKDHDDLNDLISAFSLDSSKRRHSRSKVLIFSPSKPKVSSISGSPALRLQQSRSRVVQSRNNQGPQRTFQLQNAYNFSPTTTKFTLLYGHHQPTTFKIVSPTKLGLDNSQNHKSQDKSKLMEEIMGKRSKLFSNNNVHSNNSPVFRSLPDFSSSSISSKSKPKTPPVKLKRLMPLAADINVNGRGLGEQPEKPKLQVRPDWAAKYLK